MTQQGGGTVRWQRGARPLQIVIAILVVSGFAIAAGVILSTIQRTQTVADVPLFLDANCDNVDGGNEQFVSQPMGQAVVFCLGVKNLAQTSLTVHLHLIAACPTGGAANVSDGPSPGDDFQGPDGQLACGVEVAGVSKTVPSTLTTFWQFSVVYTLVAGDYRWTFSAVSG